MNLWERIRKFFSRTKFGEQDAPADTAMAPSRATGGEPDPEAPDTHSTTGTTPSDTFVGRASGDDPGAGTRTGAEVRAEQGEKPRPEEGGRHRSM